MQKGKAVQMSSWAVQVETVTQDNKEGASAAGTLPWSRLLPGSCQDAVYLLVTKTPAMTCSGPEGRRIQLWRFLLPQC